MLFIELRDINIMIDIENFVQFPRKVFPILIIFYRDQMTHEHQ